MSSTELSGALWRKSSYSNGQANCVEVTAVTGRRSVVAVRDSKAPDAPSLIFTARTWRQFIDGVQATQKTCRLHTTSYQRHDVPARQVNRLLRYST
jgi:predicted secreted Zn-dependent protease